MFLLPDQVYGEESHRLKVSSRPMSVNCKKKSVAKDPDSSSGFSGVDPDVDDGYGQEMSRLLSNLECSWQRPGRKTSSSPQPFSLAKISQKFEMKKQFSVKDEIWVDLPPSSRLHDDAIVRTICRRKDPASKGRTYQTILNFCIRLSFLTFVTHIEVSC